MSSDLRALYPSIYRGVIEIDALCDAEDPLFDEWHSEMDRAQRNFFVLTCDILGIEMYERILEILADPDTESIEFRRERILNRLRMRPPFTFRFLLQRLDDIIGPGKYKAWLGKGAYHYRLGTTWRLGAEAFREAEYTLFIEAATTDIHWYHEVQVLVGKIKPANIVYILSPLISQELAITERIDMWPQDWLYHLGRWRLGQGPFLDDREDETEVIKTPEIPSLAPQFLRGHALYSASAISSVRLNGEYVVPDLQKQIIGSETTLRYKIPSDVGIREITRLELLDAGGVTLSDCAVFIPVPESDQIVIRHIITHREGLSDG